ncbi:mitochondrial 2-oxoglutarate/malate carrier protein-like [Zeugodacus cucurbitae]|uniref:mitochondrial 2-oxoglutarate/malate carrier protein-like n=1 Tax=Zeugodacus cucurbitae TaxID=28588 RepID=UPI0023D8F861|nr:mitochondrial 2-oxoglutarate/malate carrier protein-like [Zeugodacus cucurbitae]
MSEQQQKKDTESKSAATIPTVLKYVFGGTAAIAASCVMHPMDLVKTRMQVASSGGGKAVSPIEVMKMAMRNDGIAGLYKGLSASVLRQSVYSTTRIGVYTSLTEYYRELYNTSPTLNVTVLMAAFAGAVGAYAGTPADLGLVRMMTDARLPAADRRNYTSVFNALSRIVKEEGVLALWRGAVPTVGRAIVVSVAQLASYTQFRRCAKSYLGMGDGFSLHLVASIGSGLLTATASLPVDIAKTRIQNMKMIDGKPEYRGILDVLLKISRKEGVLALWRGYTPYVLRVVPTTILIFIILEQLNTAYFKYVLGEEYKSKI